MKNTQLLRSGVALFALAASVTTPAVAQVIPACDITTPGVGGSVLCSRETTETFTSPLDGLTISVTNTAVFSGFQAFNLTGDNNTLINEGDIQGQVDFSTSSSSDTLINRGSLGVQGLFSRQVQFRDGEDTFVNQAGGRLEGRVGMGRGNDFVRLESGSSVASTGEIRLGSGADLVVIEDGAVMNGTINDQSSFLDNSEQDRAQIFSSTVELSRLRGIEIFDLDTSGEITAVENGSFFATQELNLLGGGLRVDGVATINALTTVAGTTLSGVGTITSFDTLTVNGVLAPNVQKQQLGFGAASTPDDLILNIVGDVAFEPGSMLRVQYFEENGNIVDAEGVNITGAATIDNATLEITAADGIASPGKAEITVLAASDGLTGEFSSVVLPANFVLNGINYSDGFVTIDFRSQLGAGLTLTPAAAQVGAYLDDIGMSPETDGALSLVRGLLAIDDSATLNAALTDLSPQAYAASDQVTVEMGLALIDGMRSGIVGAPINRGQWRAWASAAGADIAQDANDVSGADLNLSGGIFGAGYGVSDVVELGLFVGGWSFEQTLQDTIASAEGNGFLAGAYAAYRNGPLSGNFSLAFADARSDVSRELSYFDRIARGETDLGAFVTSLQTAYQFDIGSNTAITPSIGAAYISSSRDELDETGAGSAALTVQDQSNGYLFTEAGIRLSVIEPLAERFRPFVEGGGRYEILGDNSEASAGLVGENIGFTADGLDVERSRLFLNAGVFIDIVDGIVFSAAYRGAYGDDLIGHTGQATIRIRL